MTAETLRKPATLSTADAEVDHYVCCCDEDIATCSTDVSAVSWGDLVNVCVVCDDLWPEGEPCPRCGCAECSAPPTA